VILVDSLILMGWCLLETRVEDIKQKLIAVFAPIVSAVASRPDWGFNGWRIICTYAFL
jgi:hypothetical protein